MTRKEATDLALDLADYLEDMDIVNSDTGAIDDVETERIATWLMNRCELRADKGARA